MLMHALVIVNHKNYDAVIYIGVATPTQDADEAVKLANEIGETMPAFG